MLAATAFAIAGSVASAVSAKSQAMDESARLDSEAKLADTQALQRDTMARDDLDSFLSSVRASRAANGLGGTSPNARILEKENSENADHNRLVQRADDRQRAANFRTASKSVKRQGNFSLFTGIAKAGVPLAQYGAYKGWGS